MNDLQKLIKLRGLTVRIVAEEIGHGYHHVQKIIKGTHYKRSDGSFGTYANHEVQEAIASMLGIPHSLAWGSRSQLALRRLIRLEIKKQAKQREEDLQKEWLYTSKVAEKGMSCNV